MKWLTVVAWVLWNHAAGGGQGQWIQQRLYDDFASCHRAVAEIAVSATTPEFQTTMRGHLAQTKVARIEPDGAALVYFDAGGRRLGVMSPVCLPASVDPRK